jgi:hypothetical protein
MDLVLAKRRGFIKIALQTGTSLIPVIGFGENDLYSLAKGKYVDKLHSLSNALFRCRFPFIYGSFAALVPFKRQLVTVGNKVLIKLVNPLS